MEPTRRWVPITILALTVAGLMGVIVSISVGEKGPQQIRIEGTDDTQQLLGGIRQLGRRLGPDDASVTVTVFQDVQCPRCADFQFNVIDPLVEQRVRTGEIKMEWRNFPLGQKPVTLGSIAIAAAEQQDHGWQFADLFMRNLDQVPTAGVTAEFLNEIAAAVPKLDTVGWEAAYSADEANQIATEDVQIATDMRLRADPAVIVEGPGGSQTLQDAPDLASIEAAIDAVR